MLISACWTSLRGLNRPDVDIRGTIYASSVEVTMGMMSGGDNITLRNCSIFSLAAMVMMEQQTWAELCAPFVSRKLKKG